MIDGYGYTWESITEEEVRQVYQYAQDFNAERFCVWLANETDLSKWACTPSFLNYPKWWIRFVNVMVNYRVATPYLLYLQPSLLH